MATIIIFISDIKKKKLKHKELKKKTEAQRVYVTCPNVTQLISMTRIQIQASKLWSLHSYHDTIEPH